MYKNRVPREIRTDRTGGDGDPEKQSRSDRFVDTSAILMLLSQSLPLSRSIKRTPKHIVFNGAESAINSYKVN